MVSYDLILNYENCTGCRLCETVCALAHAGVLNPQLSRIRVITIEKGPTFTPIPTRCMQCVEATCQDVCPTQAISTDHETGSRMIDEKKCIGCSTCVGACPFGSATLDRSSGRASICDLCQGKPMCVQFCPFEALEYVKSDIGATHLRKNRADRILKTLKWR
jgi:Fe-S-cluster-containing hydrogenase component 2